MRRQLQLKVIIVVTLAVCVLLYGGISLALWLNRPPFSNHYGFNEVSSWIAAWQRHSVTFAASDGSLVLIDKVDNVVVVVRPRKGLTDHKRLYPFRDKSDVVLAGPSQKCRLPWRANCLFVVDASGAVTCRAIERGAAVRLYRFGDPACADKVLSAYGLVDGK